jgi:toxin ParE1/3/4
VPVPVRHTSRARADLLDIWLEIASKNPAAADRLYDRLEARVKILGEYPEIGTARPDIAVEARMLVESSYLILYRIRVGDVQIVRVLHGARDIDRHLFEEGE